MDQGSSTAEVLEWNGEEFWGVLSSPQTPGGCWFSGFDIANQPAYGSGLTLGIGEQVQVDWERVQGGTQDGYRYRAVRITRS
jgi:CspA family cold shock protein